MPADADHLVRAQGKSLCKEGTEISELRDETGRIVAAFEPQCSDETARRLQRLWSQIPPTKSGAGMVRADVREEFKALGWA